MWWMQQMPSWHWEELQEELEKSKEKEEGGRIKGTFSHVVTHEGFLRDQAEHTQQRLDEAELEKLKEEAKEGWRKFNETQKAEVVKWQEEKECWQSHRKSK
ncbi:uncharacterized protein EI90DRAFT_3021054 [Cantharellus anzutake]|uniref:uncharacterized protein n=1 Tax=Cantharellus anzutake TaxID=1750568 RepID=UPI001907FA08|nr:uncharacterized protein EI90DRAFT_3021054 [Cantharellus anzutake]KAF8318334.1 hypothetical protein EI90DRAFT_3021054 [Cantharellus anzutake]